MKFLNFKDKNQETTKPNPEDDVVEGKQKDSKTDEDKEDELRNKGSLMPITDLPFKTNSPVDVVTGKQDKLPWAATPYNCKPGHGIALVDVLRRVARDVRQIAGVKIAAKDGEAPASAEVNWDHAFSIITDSFKANGLRLVTFEDREDAQAIPYYTKNTKDGIFFWITPRAHAEKAISDAVRELKATGIVAMRRECGIVVHSAMPARDGHSPEEVARFSRGVHVSTEEKRGGPWHTLHVDDVVMRYKYDSISHKVEVHCQRGGPGLISTKSEFTLTHSNSRQLSKVLKYQAARFKKIFDPATYGLQAERAPFRLKKHVLIYCGGGKTLVITPDDQAFLLTSKGEYALCKAEGRIALSVGRTFHTVKNTKTMKFVYGDVWLKFGHLLQRRELLV